MVGAYLTEVIFSAVDYDVAKVVFVQKGTSFTLQNEGIFIRDIFFQPFAEIALDGLVISGGIGVDVDFPADAAVVGAFVGGAAEEIIVRGGSENHGVTSLLEF